MRELRLSIFPGLISLGRSIKIKPMKKFYTLTGAIFVFAVAASAQCTLAISASTNDTICSGQTTQLTANITVPTNASNLTTTLAGGNNHRGNMFDLFATNTLTITSFDAHPMANTTIAVYYRTSPYAGFETSSAGWTFIGSAAVTAQPFGTATPVPVPINVTIPAGQTYSFYVTSTNTTVSLNYTDGSVEGATFVSDANLTFRQGVGMEYPFSNGGGVFRPRVWNGVIHYTTPVAGSPTYLWSTTGVSPSIIENPITSTVYTVQVNIPGCPSTLNDTFAVDISTPTANAGNDFGVCAGDFATLTGGGTGNGFLQYFWDQAVINNVPFQPFMTQSYILTLSDGYGCTDTDTVNIAYNPLPTVNAGNDTTVCAGSMLTFNGTGASSYMWDNGVTDGVPYPVFMSMTYEVIGTDVNGCTDRDTIVVTADTLDASVAVLNETITALDSTASYQWIDCSTMQPLAGQTAQSFTATVNGSYAVIVNNGICTDTSACQMILSTGIGVGAAQNISLYPNPTDGYFTLNTGTIASQVMVTDISGKVITVLEPQNTNLTISLSNEAAGMYFVKITGLNGGTTTLKVVKQ
jgi:hypothetical protein